MFVPVALARSPGTQAGATVVLRAALSTARVILRDAAAVEVERFCERLSALVNASAKSQVN